VFITLVGGTIFYSLEEGWSVVDAFYFSVTTLTTVGLGDLTPQTTIGKLFTVVYIFAGLSVILRFIDVVAKETLAIRQGVAVERKAKKMLPRVRPGPATPYRLPRTPLLGTWVNKGKRAEAAVQSPLTPRIVRLLLGSPYLAIQLLEERLALFVELLVIANQLQLLYGKVAQAFGDLLDVHLVVALYGEGSRLRRPLGALDRGPYGAGRGSNHASHCLPGRPRSFLDVLGGPLGTGPVAREGVVEELGVSFEGFLRQRLPGLSLPCCLLGEFLGSGAASVGLLPEVFGNELGELSGAALLALARFSGLLVDEPV
jgi:hypothetical protein